MRLTLMQNAWDRWWSLFFLHRKRYDAEMERGFRLATKFRTSRSSKHS